MNWALVLTEDNVRRLLVGDFPTSLGGAALTITLAALGIAASTALGIVGGYMRYAGPRPLRWLAAGYVELIRNIPLLVLVFWLYFVPPYFAIEPSKFGSILTALVLFNAAYVAEIIRGGLLAVPTSATEAARAMGMSRFQEAMYVALPIAAFNSLPALAGRYITLLKNTSLAFLIGLADLTEIARQINNRLMTAPIEVYGTILVLYFLMNRALSAAMRPLERREIFNRVFCGFAR